MKQIYVMPGTLAVSSEPAEIRTLLGSCVAIVMYDRFARVGGLNHFLLPEVSEGEKPGTRYGSYAIPELLRQLQAAGAHRSRLVAHVFGGASVLESVKIGSGIGRQNVELALRQLAEAGIRLVEQNTGGIQSRRIIFNTDTFEVIHFYNAERKSA
jgi:chemotaxis receptor (MCP) glutamine deamidase CheD